jgi:hypothetical protein
LGKKCGEVRMFENESDVFLWSGELHASQYIAVITHSSPKLLSDFDVVDLVVFRTRKKVFAGLPEVFPRITRSVGKALCKFAMVQTFFVPKGNKMRQFCKETLEWEPEKVMDVFHESMKRGRGAKDNLDNVAEDLLGGEFCKRGWKFDGTLKDLRVARLRVWDEDGGKGLEVK